jgi:hypothetical protein
MRKQHASYGKQNTIESQKRNNKVFFAKNHIEYVGNKNIQMRCRCRNFSLTVKTNYAIIQQILSNSPGDEGIFLNMMGKKKNKLDQYGKIILNFMNINIKKTEPKFRFSNMFIVLP